MAVVFAAGVVSYTSISKNSRDARRRADLEAVRQALEMCRSIAGTYPSNIYPASNSIVCSDTNSTVTMKNTPLDPRPCPTHSNGQYTYSLVAGNYTLTADCMEDTAKEKTITNP